MLQKPKLKKPKNQNNLQVKNQQMEAKIKLSKKFIRILLKMLLNKIINQKQWKNKLKRRKKKLKQTKKINQMILLKQR